MGSVFLIFLIFAYPSRIILQNSLANVDESRVTLNYGKTVHFTQTDHTIVSVNYYCRASWTKTPKLSCSCRIKGGIKLVERGLSVNHHVRKCVQTKWQRAWLSWLSRLYPVPPSYASRVTADGKTRIMFSRQRWTWLKKREWNYCYCALPHFLPDDDASLDGCFITFLTLQ